MIRNSIQISVVDEIRLENALIRSWTSSFLDCSTRYYNALWKRVVLFPFSNFTRTVSPFLLCIPLRKRIAFNEVDPLSTLESCGMLVPVSMKEGGVSRLKKLNLTFPPLGGLRFHIPGSSLVSEIFGESAFYPTSAVTSAAPSQKQNFKLKTSYTYLPSLQKAS